MSHEPFQCLRKLGSGAYGKVYSCIATAKEGKTPFALKRNYINQYTDFFGSIRELDILTTATKKQHPYIIHLRGIISRQHSYIGEMSPMPGVANNRYHLDDWHFDFELAQADLSRWLRQYPGTSYAELKTWAVHILMAVDYLHERGIIHRDLKPENLMIVKSPGGNVCKLGDFGTGKQYTVHEHLTPGTGTVEYRAPEVNMHSECATPAADVWAIGCILFRLFTGRTLFPCLKDSSAKLQKLHEAEVPKVRSYLDMIDDKQVDASPGPQWADLKNVIECCLSLKPEKRPSIRQILDGKAFEAWRKHINEVRNYYQPPPLDRVKVTITANALREQVLVRLLELRSVIATRPWFRMRMLFMTVELFDRYLATRYPVAANYSVDDVASNVFMLGVCFYLSINYHATDTFGRVADDTWNSMIKLLIPTLNTDTLPLARQMAEYLLTNVFPPGDIYRPTVFEVSDSKALAADQQIELFKFYVTADLSACTSPLAIVNTWKESLTPRTAVAVANAVTLAPK